MKEKMEEEDLTTGGLFDDPEGYYPPPPPPTKQTYTLRSGKAITLHLVGASPTEAHHLWNGAKIITDYLEDDSSRVKGRTVLELGAAAGLPSLAARILGARKVVMTDFPDPDLISNMQKNIDECEEALTESERPRLQQGSSAIEAAGFVWGGDVGPLLARLPTQQDESVATGEGATDVNQGQFDVLILADLLFRHNEHGSLVKTIKEAMHPSPSSVAYVFFTSYRPWKAAKDMAFFDVARESGLRVEQVVERKLDKPLFENDPGDLEVQKTVKGFEVRWPVDDGAGRT